MVGRKMSETAVVMIPAGLLKPTHGGARLPYLQFYNVVTGTPVLLDLPIF